MGGERVKSSEIDLAKCEVLSEIVKLINERSKELNIHSYTLGCGVSRALVEIYKVIID